MFLANDPHCQQILDMNDPVGNLYSRKIAYWFQDIQYMLDHKNLENALLRLICATKIIYERDPLDDNEENNWVDFSQHLLREKRYKQFGHRTLTREESEAVENELKARKVQDRRDYRDGLVADMNKCYHFHLKSLKNIANESSTLDTAKAQLQAFEKQQKRNASRVELHYHIADIPDSVLHAFFDLKGKYPALFKLNWEETDFIADCRRLFENCRRNPISLVLLPILLTMLMVDGTTYDNLYVYLKPRRQYMSIERQKELAQLYEDVCQLLRLGYENLDNWWIPIFDWNEIKRLFYLYVGLSAEDQREAEKYFSKLQRKNGLSKPEEKELAQLPYGEKLQALAKICNLNYFMMITLQTPKDMIPPNVDDSNVIFPAKAKSAYKLLMDDKLLPRPEGAPKSFDSYFGNLYTKLHSYQFSYIAFIRYYHLPLDQIYKYMPNGIENLAHSFEFITDQYAQRIVKEFGWDLYFLTFYKDLDSQAADRSSGVVRIFDYGNKDFKESYIRKGYQLSALIADKFSENDYRRFISSIDHFECQHFREYLTQFCKAAHISLYPAGSTKENLHLERNAFSTIMEFAQYYLVGNFYQFWETHISTEFGLYDDRNVSVKSIQPKREPPR